MTNLTMTSLFTYNEQIFMKWKPMNNKFRTEKIFSQVKVGLGREKKLENTQGNKRQQILQSQVGLPVNLAGLSFHSSPVMLHWELLVEKKQYQPKPQTPYYTRAA